MAREDFKPKKNGGKGNMLLSPETLRKIMEAADRPTVEMNPIQFERQEKAGVVHFTYREKEPPTRPPGGGINLPLAASIAASDPSTEISVLGGYYQVGATGEWIAIPPLDLETGEYVYLIVEQDEARDVTSVTLSVESSELDAVVITESSGEGDTATSNILIADVVMVGTPPAPAIRQRRHGNITLTLWQIAGDVVRWAETVAGGIPPEE